MKRIFALCALLCVAVACVDKHPEENDSKTPVITTSYESFDVAAAGGSFQIEYTITNPIGGAPLATQCDAEWVTIEEDTSHGEVRFVVACNDTPEERQTVITLRYPAAESFPEIIVRQAATTTTALNIEVTNVDYSECTAVVTPEDTEASYVLMMADMSYFKNGNITNSNMLVDADESHFRSLMYEGITLEEFLKESNLERKGVITQRWQELSPAKEYVIYCYGIAVEGDSYLRTTPVYHHVITSRLPERGTVAFDIEIAAEGPEVSVDVAPKEWDGYFMVQFVEDTEAGFVPEGEAFGEDRERALAESFFYVADHLYYYNELSADEVMQELGYSGEAHITKTLNANHKYMVMAYAIASTEGNVPMVVSHPEIEYFTTGNVASSSMTFEVDIYNIRPRSVDISITPSTDEPYTAVMIYASNLPEGSNAEQLDYVINNYPPFELTGPYEEHIDQLPPDTEFVLAIYGYYAGVPTTELFVYRFATTEDGVGGNIITEVMCTAYDIHEVAALEPYYSNMSHYADYLMSVEVVTAEPSPALHFDIFSKSAFDEYGLETIREMLLEYSYSTSPDWTTCYYGNEYVVCGMAEDADGFVGEMYVSEPISFTKEDVGDAAVFVDLYKDYVNFL